MYPEHTCVNHKKIRGNGKCICCKQEWQWRKQGIYTTTREYNQRFLQQQGKCGICGTMWIAGKRRLHVDHDHATGRIRGLLCYYCNTHLAFVDYWRVETQKYLGNL